MCLFVVVVVLGSALDKYMSQIEILKILAFFSNFLFKKMIFCFLSPSKYLYTIDEFLDSLLK